MFLLFSKSTKEVLKMQEAVNSLHTLPIVVHRQGFRSISWQHQNKMALVFPLPGDLLSSSVGQTLETYQITCVRVSYKRCIYQRISKK